MLTEEMKYQIIEQFVPYNRENDINKKTRLHLIGLLEDEELQAIIAKLTLDIMSSNIYLMAEMEYDLDGDVEENIFDTINNMTAYYKIKQSRILNKLEDLILSNHIKVDTSKVCFVNDDSDISIVVIQLISGILKWIYKTSGMSSLGRPIVCDDIIMNILNDIDPAAFDEFKILIERRISDKLDTYDNIAKTRMSSKICTSIMGSELVGFKSLKLGCPTFTIDDIDTAIESGCRVLDMVLASRLQTNK